MKTRIYILVFALALMAQMSVSVPAQAAGLAECVQAVADNDFISKQAYQMALRDMIVAPKPEFKELANLNRDLQIALAEARKTVIAYLLKHEPDRLVTTGGLSKFTNFDWSEKDQEKFVQVNGAHAQLAEKVEMLKKANDSHPDWGKMRAYMNKELFHKPELSSLMTNFFAGQKKLGNQLAKCPAK